jgi:ATP-binding cassette, subfamily B, bacterial
MSGEGQQDEAPTNLLEALVPTGERGLRRLPRLARSAVAIVVQAAPVELRRSALLQVVAAAAIAGQLLFGRELLAGVTGLEDDSVWAVVPALLGFALVTLLSNFATAYRGEQERLLGELVTRHTTEQVLDVSTAVDLLAYESSNFYNRLQRARINASSRTTQMVSGLMGMASAVIAIGGIAVALLFLEPLFLLVLLFAYVPIWFATARASRLGYRFTVEQTERDRRREYMAYVLSRKEEAAEVRAFGLTDFFKDRYHALYEERLGELRTVMRQRLKLTLLGGALSQLLNVGCLALLIWFVAIGRLTFADAGAAAGAVLLFAQRLRGFANSSSSLYESSLFIDDFLSFVAAMPDIVAARGTERPPADGFQQIEVEGVGFSYPAGRGQALRDVSLRIGRGEVIALVGENGSGKTTLAKLLAGLYRPDEGTIRWDGRDTAALDPAGVRDAVTVIFQDYAKYMLSAEENIRVGRIDGSGALSVEEAARRAAADTFLAVLPKGYDTTLGAQFFGGSDLSVGQWQRVALARAFYRDAPMLILDEPTAAMDPRSEANLFERIRELYQGRTVVLISHRFSTVKSADRIYVLRAGEIVEGGSHAELMRREGLYAELFTLQASSYLDEPASG